MAKKKLFDWCSKSDAYIVTLKPTRLTEAEILEALLWSVDRQDWGFEGVRTLSDLHEIVSDWIHAGRETTSPDLATKQRGQALVTKLLRP